MIAVQAKIMSDAGGGIPNAVVPVVDRMTEKVRLITCAAPSSKCMAELCELNHISAIWPSTQKKIYESVSLIHTHGLWSTLSYAAKRWRQRTGTPTIVSPHGMLDDWALRQGKRKKEIALLAVELEHMNSSACVHALNDGEAEAIRRCGIRAPIAIIPNGIDKASQTPVQKPPWITRNTLLFLGRLHAKKGITELVEGFAIAKERIGDWQLVIAGWDDGPNDFKEQAKRVGAEVVFPGSLFGEQKRAAYAHSSAFILPSHSEGLPMTVLEAWAHELPVFMTSACNLPEGFEHGAAVELKVDASSIADALVTFLNDPRWIQEAGQYGKSLVDKKFNWDTIAGQWEAVYQWAKGNGERPSFIHD